AQPLAGKERTRLTFHLAFQHKTYMRHTLGRFRLSVSEDSSTFAREEARLAVAKLTDPWTRLAAAVSLAGDPSRAAGYFGKAWDRAGDGKVKSEIVRTLSEDESGLAALEALGPPQRGDFEKPVGRRGAP